MLLTPLDTASGVRIPASPEDEAPLSSKADAATRTRSSAMKVTLLPPLLVGATSDTSSKMTCVLGTCLMIE